MSLRQFFKFKIENCFFYLRITAIFVGVLSFSLAEEKSRDVSSVQNFPWVKTTADRDEILQDYKPYLRFVLEAGKNTDSRMAVKLADTYSKLEKHFPDAAARFLKGLRFEMLQKLELMGVSYQSVNTSTPEMKRWVRKFLKEWNREADEALFRSVAIQKTRKSAE